MKSEANLDLRPKTDGVFKEVFMVFLTQVSKNRLNNTVMPVNEKVVTGLNESRLCFYLYRLL